MHHVISQRKPARLARVFGLLAAGLACAATLATPTVQAQQLPGKYNLPQLSPGIIFIAVPNLAWDNRASYRLDASNTATTRIFVDGLGVDGAVDVLDNMPFSLSISEEFSNRSLAFIRGDYDYTIRIFPMRFTVAGGAVGWIRGSQSIYEQTLPGPALTSGESFTTDFDPIFPQIDFNYPVGSRGECGMYEVELTVDSNDAVFEGRFENDNVTRHHFFVESDQAFSIRRNTLLTRTPPAPIPFPVPFATFDLVVPGWSTAERLYLIGSTHSIRSAPDARVDTAPTPPPAVLFDLGPPPATAFDAITMRVTDPTPNAPIEIFDFQTQETGKITVVSEDGCVIRQRSASVTVP